MPDDKQKAPPGPADSGAKKDGATDTTKLAASEWTERRKPTRRDFPGPRGGNAPLRAAFERGAFADVVAHAKESLQAEICGALAGDVCEDDDGPFVHVKAAIRGSAAKEGTTHVTFTQETWNTIHKTMERQFPKLQILGWYHSHPGFGVEFSEMDTFIQRNFFPAPTQIAFVTDPLGGDAAICYNTPDGIRHLDRFWVDGREHPAKAPAREAAKGGGPAGGGASGDVREELRNLESRLNQVLQSLEEQRRRFNGMLMTLFVFVAVVVALYFAWNAWQSYASRMEPPKINASYVPVPVQVGDKTLMVGLAVVEWQVPPEMDAMMNKLAKARAQAEAKAMNVLSNAAGMPDTTNATNATNVPAKP